MIIALKGPAQCGKSTLASMLEKELSSRGFNVKRTAFSDFVRDEIQDAILSWRWYDDSELDREAARELGCFDLIDSAIQEILSRPLEKEEPFLSWCAAMKKRFNWRVFLEHRPAHPLSRHIQQVWGQDFRRAQDPLYWIKKSFLANAEFILESGNNILIEESCRQLNEGHYCHALGGVVLDLKPLPSPTESEGAAMSHAVEQAAMSWKGDCPIDMARVFAKSESEKLIWIREIVDESLHEMGLPQASPWPDYLRNDSGPPLNTSN